MSDQFNRQKITREIARIKNQAEQAAKELAEMRQVFNRTHAQVVQERNNARDEIDRLRQALTDLKEFAYERAPKIAAEQSNRQTEELRAEVERLRLELNYIANAQRRSFISEKEFRQWAQSRARHALGLKIGELAIKRG